MSRKIYPLPRVEIRGTRSWTATIAKAIGHHTYPRCCLIAPTMIETLPGIPKLPQLDKALGGDAFKKKASNIPLGPHRSRDDIARVALFLVRTWRSFHYRHDCSDRLRNLAFGLARSNYA